ncbi:MAG: Ig-like domain-containing protein, partial [Clostridia bacterium]|nr:Ig-like domain-containing protein [Clostridia bacterium]
MWLNADGTENSAGEYIRVKHTHADDITDCARPDGSPIDLKLYMHIVYPTNPAKKVPVMCLASSSEHLCGCSATPDRPHLLGFAFRGYAAVMYDYGYTPMARVDHYDYFDGYPKPGHITGDNPTYSIQFYNDKRMNCAAMRYLRLLALRDGLPFDTEAIGVYGNSKGGWMGFLGEEHPETMVSRRIFGGHHDETRYENGKTETVGIINGGEPQPWLTYDGKPIDSGADLIYCSCGGTDDSITAGHAPVFISCNRRDSSCYGTSNAFVNICREYDIPAMWVDIDAPHTIVQGTELNFGYDTYVGFYDFTGYFLKGDAVKVVGVKADQSKYPAPVTVRFSGSVPASEIEKCYIYRADGKNIDGSWTGAFGGVEWTFTPDRLDCGAEYTVTVPVGVCGDNGKPMAEEYKWSFTTVGAVVTAVEKGKTLRFTAPKGDFEASYIAVRVENDGSNAIGIYDKNGTRVGFVGVSGKGIYRADISEYMKGVSAGETVELTMKTERAVGEFTVFETGEGDNFSGITVFKRAISETSATPDGIAAIRIDGFEADTHFP